MKFSVETWAPEYGIAIDAGGMEESSDSVDASIEVELSKWEPRAVEHFDWSGAVAFIDGTRRIDARVWVADDQVVSRPGVCATVAAGVVQCWPSRAEVTDIVVERNFYAYPFSGMAAISTAHGAYAPVASAGDGPEDFYLSIHERMTQLETALAPGDVDVVVFDGPLRGRNDPRGVGYVKTQHVHYLVDELRSVLGRLGIGERTPLFEIASRGFSRRSWYVRLPGKQAHPLSGIVRCELPMAGTVADAIERADLVTGLLPRYASEPHKDGRAPQNLYPIAGLERDLRHRMGDIFLMERALRVAATQPQVVPTSESDVDLLDPEIAACLDAVQAAGGPAPSLGFEVAGFIVDGWPEHNLAIFTSPDSARDAELTAAGWSVCEPDHEVVLLQLLERGS